MGRVARLCEGGRSTALDDGGDDRKAAYINKRAPQSFFGRGARMGRIKRAQGTTVTSGRGEWTDSI